LYSSFVDRDMFMRYLGGGVGHQNMQQSSVGTEQLDAMDLDEEDAETEEDPIHGVDHSEQEAQQGDYDDMEDESGDGDEDEDEEEEEEEEEETEDEDEDLGPEDGEDDDAEDEYDYL
jgi:hypothetical protein